VAEFLRGRVTGWLGRCCHNVKIRASILAYWAVSLHLGENWRQGSQKIFFFCVEGKPNAESETEYKPNSNHAY
jgi:hypothetical protein